MSRPTNGKSVSPTTTALIDSSIPGGKPQHAGGNVALFQTSKTGQQERDSSKQTEHLADTFRISALGVLMVKSLQNFFSSSG
jgi:hypothetical protein